MWEDKYEIDDIIEVNYGYKKIFRYIFLSSNNSESSLIVMQDAQSNQTTMPLEAKYLKSLKSNLLSLNCKEVSRIAKNRH